MTRFVCSHQLVVERQDGDSMVLYHCKIGTRLEVNRATYDFLKLFDQPCAFEDLAGFGPLDLARPVFETLRRAGFLVEEGRLESIYDKLIKRISPGFFGCTTVGLGGELAQRDLVFLGVPYDFGGTREPGARFAPRVLREISVSDFHFAVGREAQASRGWYDNDLEIPILERASMADVGNICVSPAESPSHVFSKIREVIERVLEAGALPVVIGGDHSITYAVVSAFRSPLSLLQIDAHSDRAVYDASCFENHHGNVMSRLMGSDRIRHLYQVGVRGTTFLPQRGDGQSIRLIPPRRLRALGISRFVSELPDDGPYYVSLDIDSLDPIYAPGTSTLVPNGLSFEEVKQLLREMGQRRLCIGFDLVEVNPRRDLNDMTSIVALELLLSFLGAWFSRRTENENA